jgi:hypothetical protein
MNPYTEETISKLLAICQSCTGHRTEKDSYTSPAFAEYLGRPLTVSDIPMQTFDYTKYALNKEPSATPWQDSIKNFILDCMSVQPNKRYMVCLLMVEYGYKFSDVGDKFLEATADIVSHKYGVRGSIIITVEPDNEECSSFTVVTKQDERIGFKSSVDKDALVSVLMSFYMPKRTLLMCHDSYAPEYREVISMMPECKWSLSCTPSNFIRPANKYSDCKYICPVYSCFGSMETRAVGYGPVIFGATNKPTSYTGKMNYYARCIRGSRHSSGRCFDCQTLYKTLVSVGASPNASPISLHSVVFSDSVLGSDE